MDAVYFEAIKPQLVERGFSTDDLIHPAWDTYNNWIERGRIVRRGQKSVRCNLIEKTERSSPTTGDVVSEWERNFNLDIFHHNMTSPVDATRHVERNGDFDQRMGNKDYEADVQPTNGSVPVTSDNQSTEDSVDESISYFDKLKDQ